MGSERYLLREDVPMRPIHRMKCDIGTEFKSKVKTKKDSIKIKSYQGLGLYYVNK